jgi:hypothetical protein
MTIKYSSPYTFPLGRVGGQSVGWHLCGRNIKISAATELVYEENANFLQMVQPNTSCYIISTKSTLDGTEGVVLTYINGLNRKCIQRASLVDTEGTVGLTDLDSFKYIESLTSPTTCSGEIYARPSASSAVAPVTYVPAFEHGATVFQRFTGDLMSYINQWSVRLDTELINTEPVTLTLRWYPNQDNCNCYDGPYVVIDSVQLYQSTFIMPEYSREFHPTFPLAPGGWFGVFAETDAADAFISLYIQGYDIYATNS